MSGGILSRGYPFAGILGMEDAKLALMCAMVNPEIKGVLIKGVSGVAKTTLARSVAGHLTSKALVNVPLNVTGEQLFGSLDVESAINDGAIRMQDSMLRRADGNLLYIDDVNLFDQKDMRSVMDAVLTGTVRVERDGISAEYACDTTVIATMNMSETYIDAKLSDCFDMCVVVRGSADPGARSEVSCRVLSFSEDPAAFAGQHSDDGARELVARAGRAVGGVEVPDGIVEAIVGSCTDFGAEGYRGELSTIRVSKALAALDGRSVVDIRDVRKALFLCLSHRRTATAKRKDGPAAVEERVDFFGDSHMKRFIHDDRAPKDGPSEDAADSCAVPEATGDAEAPDLGETVFDVGEAFEAIDLAEAAAKTSYLGGNRAKRVVTDDGSRSGRYVRSRMADGRDPDLALDATIRAAAPYQLARHIGGDPRAVIIEDPDIREKVRERHGSCTFMFMVDTSGSLIVRSRMIAVKTAILSMLSDHYVKRDRVGISTFNGRAVGLLLPPTKSVDCVGRLLDDISAGERTPLSEALVRMDDYMTTYTRKHPSERCFIVLMTDGVANVPLHEGADPVAESLSIASGIDVPNTSWIVVDTASKRKETECARDLARMLRAGYYKLDDLKRSDSLPPVRG